MILLLLKIYSGTVCDYLEPADDSEIDKFILFGNFKVNINKRQGKSIVKKQTTGFLNVKFAAII